jgi:23S rRNA (guanosine2251-2'-O)-methyltransferase
LSPRPWRYGVVQEYQTKKIVKKFIPKRYPPKPRLDSKSVVFGVHTVMETIRAGQEIDKVLVQWDLNQPELHELLKERGVTVQKVPAEKLNRVTAKNHQGVIAFISAVNYAKLENVVADIFDRGEVPLLLLLDRITDVRNFGAIARTAECAGVNALVIPSRGAAQINSDAMKTSSGALNFLPVCKEENLNDTVRFLQESGIQVLACTEKTEKTIYDMDFRIPTAVVLGSEEDGISDGILRSADALCQIPMQGQVGSLNVSVANGVVLYEAIRQRLRD